MIILEIIDKNEENNECPQAKIYRKILQARK